MPEKFVYSAVQDNSGMIWIGTGSGLYMFNGKSFKNFPSNKDISGHQINNVLTKLYKDYDGKIWLSSLNAIQKFDPNFKTFESFKYDNGLESIIKSLPNCFFRDANKKLWIGSQLNYWYLFDEKTNKVQNFIPKSNYLNENSKSIVKFVQTHSNRTFAISNNGLFEFSKSGKINSHFNIENNKAIKNDFYDGFYDENLNCIWLAGGENGIVKFDLKTNLFTYNRFLEK
ncbi:MAG: hypothetical protein HC854_04690, partial [Flavobacterium sp.]|nr:hypothetical protein [Flavobacterium sp.]